MDGQGDEQLPQVFIPFLHGKLNGLQQVDTNLARQTPVHTLNNEQSTLLMYKNDLQMILTVLFSMLLYMIIKFSSYATLEV